MKFVALGMRLVNADIIQPSMKYALASTVSENLEHCPNENDFRNFERKSA